MKKINSLIISQNPPLSDNTGWVKTGEESPELKFLINGKWTPINGGSNSSDTAVAELVQEVKYAELVALRNANSLTPGMKYRITDYVTTTVQQGTKSANHPFDIIVEATSENTLSELAKATQHEGDTYFKDNDLGAWQLWYDLNNDTDKYEWADTVKGKGVIYKMIDEKRNDCPYDFKNILFYTTKYDNNTTYDNFYYTFSYVVDSVLYDGTVEKRVTGKCYNNSIGVYIKNNKSSLNSNIFRNILFANTCCSNTIWNNCYNNTFGGNCSYNNLGNSCASNSFGNACSYNSLGVNCTFNSFSNGCLSNSLGNTCYRNSFINSSSYNTFGNVIYDKKLDIGNNSITSTTSITLNEEYYDDGTNALVPIKHPDLSTQPSILPYKFMGNYVYEQLFNTSNGNKIYKHQFAVPNPVILDIREFSDQGGHTGISNAYFSNNQLMYGYSYAGGGGGQCFIKIVYTSMPSKEEDNYYSDYNNY